MYVSENKIGDIRSSSCVQERVNMSKLARDKMRQHRLDGPQPPADRQRIERIRHRTRNMMTDSCTEESGHLRGQFRVQSSEYSDDVQLHMKKIHSHKSHIYIF